MEVMAVVVIREWPTNIINYLFFTYLNIKNITLVTGFWLHSIPVHSGEHSGLGSGMPRFHWNMPPLEWKIWQVLLPFFIPVESPDSAKHKQRVVCI